jgi:signal transduction histidine kinase
MLVVMGSGAVWLDARRRTRRKLEHMKQQHAIEHERARIANDIHDDLGSHLTRITMLSESARNELEDREQSGSDLNQIYDTAREMTRAMDEIVWAVNPKHDTLESLANYLEIFAEDFLETAGVRRRLDMPLKFPTWPLTSEVRHNLFLAFKEALNNVVKHAGASEVGISIQVETGSFELLVQDNGHGFTPGRDETNTLHNPPRRSSGNGLENMRRRMLKIGGRCDISSVPGKGTRVLFIVPVQDRA